MLQTTERRRGAHRAKLLRRILGTGASRDRLDLRKQPDYIDLRSPPGDIAEAGRRIERLELGMQLIVETMKRSYGKLTAAIDQLAASTPIGLTALDVEHAVGEALRPLATSLDEVAETLRTFPYLVAAAADHVTERMEAARALMVEQAPVVDAETAPDVVVLPITPFDLEPVEEQFDTLTLLRRSRFSEDELDQAAWEGAAG